MNCDIQNINKEQRHLRDIDFINLNTNNIILFGFQTFELS